MKFSSFPHLLSPQHHSGGKLLVKDGSQRRSVTELYNIFFVLKKYLQSSGSRHHEFLLLSYLLSPVSSRRPVRCEDGQEENSYFSCLSFCFDFIPESNFAKKKHEPGFLLCNTFNKLILHPEICTIYFRETTLQSESPNL